MAKNALEKQFGEIDIYVFDQLLKGRIAPGMRVLDAGCGSGRNLVYLLREGYEVYAADVNAAEVDAVRAMARALGARLPEGNFRVEAVEAMSFDAGCADVVVCNTVLHFARDDAHFRAMVDGLWRVLRPGGILFCRLGSTVGMETRVVRVEGPAGRRYRSPDGSVRYLVDEALLVAETERLGGVLADPIKTTVVQDQRAMTTWVVRKND
jgi:2-polyprenyl-3-methyl-5-hydroxy-6-metoxy-1,4-benzoquinol methylase